MNKIIIPEENVRTIEKDSHLLVRLFAMMIDEFRDSAKIKNATVIGEIIFVIIVMTIKISIIFPFSFDLQNQYSLNF